MRPGNTTTYAASGDELTDTGGAIMEFTGCALKPGGTGWIMGLLILNSVNQATKISGELRLYDTTSTPAADNAAFDASDTVNETMVARIDVASADFTDGLTGTTGNCVGKAAATNFPIAFKCAAASTSLFGRFIVKSAYVPPANSERYVFKLQISQDGA